MRKSLSSPNEGRLLSLSLMARTGLCCLACVVVLSCAFFASARAVAVELTAAEREWLSQHPRVSVGVGVAFPPFQWVEEVPDGLVFKGMAADYLDLLSERLGVSFDPVFGISFREALKRGRNGAMDMYACLAFTPERAQFLAYTKPYLTYPLVVIGRDGGPIARSISDFSGKRVATVKALATYSKYVNDFPDVDMRFVFERTIPDVLRAVSDGRADLCVANLAVAMHLMRDLGLGNLKVVGGTPWSNQLRMAATNDNKIFAGILQKGLDSISIAERDAIAQKWLDSRHYSSKQGENFEEWLVRIGIGLSVVVLFILAWNRRLHTEVQRRKEVESALGRREELYRQLFESMHSGFAVCEWVNKEPGHYDWRFIELNPAFALHSGISIAQAEGKTARELFPTLSDEWGRIFSAVMHGNEPAVFERHSDEVDRDFFLSVFPLAEERFGLQVTDITERKKAMDLLVRHEKIESLANLASGMAHEINNPLGGILQGAQNIQRRLIPSLDKNQKVAQEAGTDIHSIFEYMQTRGVLRMLEGIVDSGRRAADIVAMLLEFNSGRSAQLCECDIQEVVEDVLGVVRKDVRLGHVFHTERLSIVREFDSNRELAFCNTGEIRQVVLNLVRNAVLAATSDPENKGVVRVRVKHELGHVTVSVTDNGPGMDKQTVKQIFDPFYTTRDPGSGSGLGLAVSYVIITQNHGGSIDVKSTPGEGTTFSFKLAYAPVREADQSACRFDDPGD